tara:strand:- start:1958 stop:2209 length:252 start_codon:yes stop_codon:yes gene_type:complete
MKVKILMGSDYPDGKEEKRVEAGVIADLPDKIGRSLIKNGAAVKYTKKMEEEDSKPKVRARNEKGHFIADDPNTPENEAWEEE